MKINGNEIKEKILKKLEEEKTPSKYLAVFLVGKDENSLSFVKEKEKVAQRLKIDFRIYEYPETITQDDLRKEIHKIGDRKRCGGVIVQLPLPQHINAQYLLNAIMREKDVDVLGERALGAFYAGRNKVNPPSVETLKEILDYTKFDLENATVCVLGRGKLIGKPIYLWLSDKVKEIFVLDKKSNLSYLKEANLVILGLGSPHFITPHMLSANTLVIDFGYEKEGKKIYGDFLPEEKLIEKLNITYTPTPGGTGPILVAKIFENFYRLNEEKN
jgi:methylenetetrahydrofolate dehydrogenase (NADP+)/methenyltetrahydrofolate cyclohydrolase